MREGIDDTTASPKIHGLRLVVTGLQDSVTQLHAANLRAHEAEYQAACAGYQDLSKRYVAELKQPRISLGRTVGLVAALGSGGVLAKALHQQRVA